MAHGGKRCRQFLAALRHPQQRTHRIAQRGRFDDMLEIVEQRCVTFTLSSRAATFTTNATPGKRRRVKVFPAAFDRAASLSRDA
jgi:hypothetical protein